MGRQAEGNLTCVEIDPARLKAGSRQLIEFATGKRPSRSVRRNKMVAARVRRYRPVPNAILRDLTRHYSRLPVLFLT